MKGKKTGGRRPGSLNKKNQDLIDKAKALGVDPFQILLYFAEGNWKKLGYDSEYDDKVSNGMPYQVRVISPDARARAAAEAAQYLYPKRKAIEHDIQMPKPTIIKRKNGIEIVLGFDDQKEDEK